MALYIPHSIFHLARLLYVRPETFGPYYVFFHKISFISQFCILFYIQIKLFFLSFFVSQIMNSNFNTHTRRIEVKSNAFIKVWRKLMILYFTAFLFFAHQAVKLSRERQLQENTKFKIIYNIFNRNITKLMVCDSSVGIATRYGPDGPGIESPVGARISAPVQTCPEAHPASCTMGTGSFPGGKAAGTWC